MGNKRSVKPSDIALPVLPWQYLVLQQNSVVRYFESLAKTFGTSSYRGYDAVTWHVTPSKESLLVADREVAEIAGFTLRDSVQMRQKLAFLFCLPVSWVPEGDSGLVVRRRGQEESYLLSYSDPGVKM
jgi:hypothetical protein